MTLFDIFYRHTNWWCEIPKDGDMETYPLVLDEMEACAAEYAKELRGIGDKWIHIVERETKELCSPNYYSLSLKGEKKEWHDMALEDFLFRIRKAMEHYNACDFWLLPDSLLPFYGMERVKLAGNSNENPSEGEKPKYIPVWGDDKSSENQVPPDIKKEFNTKNNHDNFIEYCYSVQSKEKPYILIAKKFAEVRSKGTEEKTDKTHTGAMLLYNYLSKTDKEGNEQSTPHLDLLKCSYRTWSRVFSNYIKD